MPERPVSLLFTAKHAPHFIGVELEVNQRFPLGPSKRWRALQAVLAELLAVAGAGW